jgi:tRNA threonylcarbamoyladenosine biosynthesis protein TsaB
MTILCIETSTSVCSAAICKDGAPVKQCINTEGSNHARLLPLYIDELLAYAREQALTIDAVALSEGPGSYTGLRIGTSTAKGLCYGLNLPLIPVPTHGVLCEAAKSQFHNSQVTIHNSQCTNSVLVPMIDARRMEVYTAIYDSQLKVDSLELKETRARAVVVESEESFSEAVLQQSERSVRCQSEGRSYYYFGDGAAKCQSVLTSENWHYLPGIVPEAQYMGALAESSRQSAISGQQLAYYEPFYLKEFVAAQSHVKGLK